MSAAIGNTNIGNNLLRVRIHNQECQLQDTLNKTSLTTGKCNQNQSLKELLGIQVKSEVIGVHSTKQVINTGF